MFSFPKQRNQHHQSHSHIMTDPLHPQPDSHRRMHFVQRLILLALLLAITAPTWNVGLGIVDDQPAMAHSRMLFRLLRAGHYDAFIQAAFRNPADLHEGRTMPLLRPYQFLRYMLYGDNFALYRIHNTLVWAILLQLVYSLAQRLTTQPAAPLLAGILVLLNPATSTLLFRLQTQEQVIAALLIGYLLLTYRSLESLQDEKPKPWARAGLWAALACVLLLLALGFKETSVAVFPAVGALFVFNLAHENRRMRLWSAILLAAAVGCGLAFLALHALTPKASGSYAAAYRFDQPDKLLISAFYWRDTLRIAYGILIYIAVGSTLARTLWHLRHKRMPDTIKWRIALLVYVLAAVGVVLPWSKPESRLIFHGVCGLAVVMAVEIGELWSLLARRPGKQASIPAGLRVVFVAIGILLVLAWIAPAIRYPLTTPMQLVTIPLLATSAVLAAVAIVSLMRWHRAGRTLPISVRVFGRFAIGAGMAYVVLFALPGIWNTNSRDYGCVWENRGQNEIGRYLVGVTPFRGRVFLDSVFDEFTGVHGPGAFQWMLSSHGRDDIVVYSLNYRLSEVTANDFIVSFSRNPSYGASLGDVVNLAGRPKKEFECELPYFNVDALQPRNMILGLLPFTLEPIKPFTSAVMTEKRDWTLYFPAVDRDPPRLADADKWDRVRESGNAGWTPLHWAAYRSQLEDVERLIAEGADANALTVWGESPLLMTSQVAVGEALLAAGANVAQASLRHDTPLHEAARLGDVQAGAAYLDRGADPEAQGVFGESPLHLAAASDRRVARLLLDRGASADSLDARGRTPLHHAAQSLVWRYNHKDRPTTALLIERGADPGAEDSLDRQPLHYAAAALDLDTARCLIESGASVSQTDVGSNTPLHVALFTPLGPFTVAMVEYLLDCGADPNAPNMQAQTPLHLASQAAMVDVVKILLEHGADVNRQDDRGCTPLYLGSQHDQNAIVSLLIERGADIERTAAGAVTPLMIAVQAQQLGATQMLLEAGARVDAVTDEGTTVLHVAAGKGATDISKILLDHGAELNATDKNGATPLTVAIRAHQQEMALLLLDRGAQLEGLWKLLLANCVACNHVAYDDDSCEHLGQLQDRRALLYTLLDFAVAESERSEAFAAALNSAAASGHLELIKTLVEAGANPLDTNDTGRSVLAKAVESGSVDAVDYLLSCGIDLSGPAGRIPLLIVAANGDAADELVPLLLNKGAPAGATDPGGVTALHRAAANGRDRAVAALLRDGADPSAADNRGETPLHTAAMNGSVEVVNKLLYAGADPTVARKDGALPVRLALGYARVEAAQALMTAAENNPPTDLLESVLTFTPPPIPWDAEAIQSLKNRIGLIEQITRLDPGSVTRVNTRGQGPVHAAAASGLLDMVDAVLAAGASVDAMDKYGRTAVHYALDARNVPLAEYLLSRGAPLDPQHAATVAIAAATAQAAHPEALKFMIERGLDPNAVDAGGRPLLLSGVEAGSTEVVDVLLGKGADIQATDTVGATALHVAAFQGQTSMVEKLLGAGADPDFRAASAPASFSGQSAPLHWCIDHPDTVRVLIAKGANVNAADADGQTPLLLALLRQQPESALALLDAGADPNLGSRTSTYPLVAALQWPDLVDKLLESGAQVDVSDTNGLSPLYHAIARKQVETVARLLEAGADVSTPGPQGTILILHAAATPEALDALIRHGADPDARNADGDTALLVAAARPRADDIAIALIEAGADPNAADAMGDTPLHRAIRANNLRMVEILVRRGADPQRANQAGMTPMALSATAPEPIQRFFSRLRAAQGATR